MFGVGAVLWRPWKELVFLLCSLAGHLAALGALQGSEPPHPGPCLGGPPPAKVSGVFGMGRVVGGELQGEFRVGKSRQEGEGGKGDSEEAGSVKPSPFHLCSTMHPKFSSDMLSLILHRTLEAVLEGPEMEEDREVCPLS